MIDLPDTKNSTIAAISDTHGKPHPRLLPILEHHRPSMILHAGDVGDLDLIKELEEIAPTVFVRGNVDSTGPIWLDSVSIHINLGKAIQIDVLLLHIAVARLRLNRETLNLLRESPAQVVIFGHSHIPFLGMDGKICLFNPGSAGPSRMGLPTTMGFIEISSGQLKFKHLDLKTGEQWIPGPK
jgi:hypothetical protein